MKFNYPPQVYEIALKLERYDYKSVTTWQTLSQIKDADEFIGEQAYRKACSAIAQEFTRKVYKHKYLEQYASPEGLVAKISAVAVTYQELLDALYTAYSTGQSDGMRRKSMEELM